MPASHRRPVTPYAPSYEGLFADEFRMNAAYTNWRPHGSDDWLLIYTEAGSGRLITAKGITETVPGDAILYAPGDPQDYSTAGDSWHLIWAHFKPLPHWLPWLRWPEAAGLRILHLKKGEVRGRFRAAMLRTIQMMRSPNLPGALDFAGNGLEEALLWAGVAGSADPWLSMDPRVHRAIDYLAVNLAAPFDLHQLARHCAASVSRLSALFKRETGFSPRNYLEQQRMRHACQLLRVTSLSIAEIAAETGFQDPFYFSNRFRRAEKQSPTEFRSRYQGKAGG